jgi:hypothetical protein
MLRSITDVTPAWENNTPTLIGSSVLVAINCQLRQIVIRELDTKKAPSAGKPQQAPLLDR